MERPTRRSQAIKLVLLGPTLLLSGCAQNANDQNQTGGGYYYGTHTYTGHGWGHGWGGFFGHGSTTRGGFGGTGHGMGGFGGS